MKIHLLHRRMRLMKKVSCYNKLQWGKLVPCVGRRCLRTNSARNKSITDILTAKLPTIDEDSTDMHIPSPADTNNNKSHQNKSQAQGKKNVQLLMMTTTTMRNKTTPTLGNSSNNTSSIKSSIQRRRPFSLTNCYVHFIMKLASAGTAARRL